LHEPPLLIHRKKGGRDTKGGKEKGIDRLRTEEKKKGVAYTFPRRGERKGGTKEDEPIHYLREERGICNLRYYDEKYVRQAAPRGGKTSPREVAKEG